MRNNNNSKIVVVQPLKCVFSHKKEDQGQGVENWYVNIM